MSGFLKNILAGGASDLISSVGNTIDNLITSKEEKEQLKNATIDLINKHQAQAQQELTRRLEIDMNSDSWLSKNIRPLTLVFILAAYTLFSITDENIGDFNINESYVELLGQWGQAIMYFYFGGRTMEKMVGIFKGSK